MAESVPPETIDEEAVLTCTVHPKTETMLRCNKCNRPMCVKCAVRISVGYRCKECVSNQQSVFYSGKLLDPLIQFAISLPLSAIAAALASWFGGGFFMWFIAIPASAFIGGFIANLAHRAVGKRWGRYGSIAVGAGIIAGAVIVAALPGLLIGSIYATYDPYAAGDYDEYAYDQEYAYEDPAYYPDEFGYLPFLYGFSGFLSIGWWIYVVVATIAAVNRLGVGKRINFNFWR